MRQRWRVASRSEHGRRLVVSGAIRLAGRELEPALPLMLLSPGMGTTAGVWLFTLRDGRPASDPLTSAVPTACAEHRRRHDDPESVRAILAARGGRQAEIPPVPAATIGISRPLPLKMRCQVENLRLGTPIWVIGFGIGFSARDGHGGASGGARTIYLNRCDRRVDRTTRW